MASKTIFVDDLDNSEGAETVSFALRGQSYEIDLSQKNSDALDKALQKYIDAAKKVGSTRASSSSRRTTSASTKRTDLDEIRAWARANGHEVSDRGRIAQAVQDAYDAAH